MLLFGAHFDIPSGGPTTECLPPVKTHKDDATRFRQQSRVDLMQDDDVLGLAVGGSWLTSGIDAFSDLDLILITRQHITNKPRQMVAFADRLGDLLFISATSEGTFR